MRGKRLGLLVGFRHCRIIPAHAGQTPHGVIGIGCAADHPRACGANSTVSLSSDFPVGSSPRMRGKPFHRRLLVGPCRIIPAHAGQTSDTLTIRETYTDHPRACGANH